MLEQFAGVLLHRLLGALADHLDACLGALGGEGGGELVVHLIEVVERLVVVAIIVIAAHVNQADLVQGDGAYLVAELLVLVAAEVQGFGLGALVVADGLGAVGQQIAVFLDGGGHAVGFQCLVFDHFLGADLGDKQRGGGRAARQQAQAQQAKTQ